MKVSLSWLKQLVDYQLSSEDLAEKLSLTSIGVKQQTQDYLELDLTYNRGDLLSLRGVAYEVSAITEAPLKFLAQIPEDFIWVGKNLPKVNVEIENKELCPVYCVAKIENLKVEESSKTWVKKLSDSGMRSVNNIADVTNLVMIEMGQPMHAFDARGVKDETIVVRTARKDERLTTLDGKTRDLNQEDLLIADPELALGIAGVMGGKDSEVSESTATILLEAAIFDPLSIRKTSKRHGLYSEASRRFQHGLTKIRLLQALDGAIKLYQSLGGQLTAITLEGDFGEEKRTVEVNIKRVNNLLGVSLDEETITKCLNRLNFNVIKKGQVLEVIPPYFRKDIEIEEDVIEEVARIYGYEKIDARPLDGEEPEKLDQSVQQFIHDLKKTCKEAGLTETQTYSFYSSKVLKALGGDSSKAVKIANPISSETEFLRTFIWPNLVEVVAKNLRAGFKDIAVFEIGKVYSPEEPKEFYRLSIALMNGSDNPAEELVAIFNQLASHSSSGKAKLKPGGMIKELETIFHPNRHAGIYVGDEGIGSLAELHPRFLNEFGIDKRVAVLEIRT